MKKLLPVFLLATMAVMAADMTGYIVDKGCSTKKGMWTNEKCAASCIKRGDPAVFVTEDGKVYTVAEQDKVKDFAGKKVSVTADVKGETISVSEIKAAM